MASPRPTGTTARWMSKQRLRWSFGWFESSGDATTTRRELGVAAVAMASPSAHLDLHGEEEGNGGGVSWWRRGVLEARPSLTGGASAGVRPPRRVHAAATA